MRAVFVNHCHPDTPHVCAVRAREFAAALCRRGHRIILLTQTRFPDDPAEPEEETRRRLAAHDWSVPFVMACRPTGHGVLRYLREGRLPAGLSKLTVGAYYASLGSVFADWGAGARPYLGLIAEAFAPDVVWANFGNTECLRIGRAVARHCACPWVLDVKDYWSTFIPPLFHRHLARRFGDAAAMTTLSQGHVADVRPWLSERLIRSATVIHSGIPGAFLVDQDPVRVARDRIAIVGAVYEPGRLKALIDGVGRVAADAGSAFTVEYAGDAGATVREAAEGRPGIASVVDHGYIPLARLYEIQRHALANVFIRSGPGWYQHKVPELLTAGRPILCLPGAHDETVAIARAADVPFFNCTDDADVAAAIRAALASGAIVPDRDYLAGYAWDRRAELLERALEAVCR